MNRYLKQIYGGIVTENPTFVLMLGMCPTLAVTTGTLNGLGMGMSTAVVLILSNMFVSILRDVIPESIRIPAYIVITASFVTITGLVLQAFFPEIYNSLGVYIPLIVVNCIILGRAEGFASKHGILLSVCDGIGMGIGFTIGLVSVGTVRELLGKGTILGYDINNKLLGGIYTPGAIMVLAPGAFFVLAVICAIRRYRAGRNRNMKRQTGCAGCKNNCSICGKKW